MRKVRVFKRNDRPGWYISWREIPDPFEVAIEWDNEPMFQNCTFVEPNEPNDCKVSYDLIEGVFYAFKYDDGGWILTEIDTSAIEVNDCLLVDN